MTKKVAGMMKKKFKLHQAESIDNMGAFQARWAGSVLEVWPSAQSLFRGRKKARPLDAPVFGLAPRAKVGPSIKKQGGGQIFGQRSVL